MFPLLIKHIKYIHKVWETQKLQQQSKFFLFVCFYNNAPFFGVKLFYFYCYRLRENEQRSIVVVVRNWVNNRGKHSGTWMGNSMLVNDAVGTCLSPLLVIHKDIDDTKRPLLAEIQGKLVAIYSNVCHNWKTITHKKTKKQYKLRHVNENMITPLMLTSYWNSPFFCCRVKPPPLHTVDLCTCRPHSSNRSGPRTRRSLWARLKLKSPSAAVSKSTHYTKLLAAGWELQSSLLAPPGGHCLMWHIMNN